MVSPGSGPACPGLALPGCHWRPSLAAHGSGLRVAGARGGLLAVVGHASGRTGTDAAGAVDVTTGSEGQCLRGCDDSSGATTRR